MAIADGDTITVLRGREQIRVRLWGIDAPERRQPFGSRARSYWGSLIHGKVVDVEVRDTDRYGRTVAVIEVDGRNVNEEMVRAGLTWWFRRFAANDEKLARAEREARASRRGLWADRNPVPPWEWRSQAHAR